MKRVLPFAVIVVSLWGCEEVVSGQKHGCDPGCVAPEQCIGNVCIDTSEACNPACVLPFVCSGGACVDASTICKPACEAPLVCYNNSCTDPSMVCETPCDVDEICVQGHCTKKDQDCTPECVFPQQCIAGQCELCANPCGKVCCQEGTLCDTMSQRCAPQCADGQAQCGGECCMDGLECSATMGCTPTCLATQHRCNGVSSTQCCKAEELCDNGQCKEDCGSRPECNGACCSEGEVCENNKCMAPCAGMRCGAQDEYCCTSAQLCLYQKCLPKGDTCASANDCAMDEFCEQSSQSCVKVEDNPNACIVKPVTGPFNPQLKWHWPTESMPGGKAGVYPDFDQVMNVPIVINLTDDNGDGKIDENDIPDLAFTTFSRTLAGYHYNQGKNVLRVISGKDGTEIATHPDMAFPLANDLGAAKINSDEFPEIVLPKYEGGVLKTMIFNLKPKADGSGHELVTVASLEPGSSFARFANLDGSKYPQIITSAGIIEYDENLNGGTYQWRCKASFGSGHHGSTIADLDGDGEQEIVGTVIYDKDCKSVSTDTIPALGTVLADIDLVSDNANGRLDVEQIGFISGGLGSNADLTPPPGKIEAYKLFKTSEGFKRELIWSKVMPIDYAYAERVTGQKCSGPKLSETYQNGGTPEQHKEWYRRYSCATGGGPLVVADFNGDKKPDIGLATKWSYVVYNGLNGEILWADFTTKDASSMATGSSLFDFEGDGVSEVLYADEIELHVYKGPGSGVIDPNFNYCSAELLITPIPNTSGTLVEYPIVVDVDNDGHSEIVLISNDYPSPATGVTGIRAFEDPTGHWVRTRRIWNQFDYHVTNINEDGTVPKVAQSNWLVKSLNNFRQNVQPDGLFNAPNLVALEITFDTKKCPALITLKAAVENKGSLGIPAGLSVKFYVKNANNSGKPGLIGETKLTTTLVPGASASVSLDWDAKTVTIDGTSATLSSGNIIFFVVDEQSSSRPVGFFHECIETDNTSADSPLQLCPAN